MVGFEQVPVVTLWGVNPTSVRRQLDAMDFPQKRIRLRSREEITTGGSALSSCFSSAHILDDTFVRDGSIVTRTNIIEFKHADPDMRPGAVCFHCRLPFTQKALGVPIDLSVSGKICTFRVVDESICSFECLYTWTLDLPQSTHLKIYTQVAVRLIQFLYYLLYPDAPLLQMAQPFRLLKNNGGPLSREQFFKDAYHVFRECPFVVFDKAHMTYESQFSAAAEENGDTHKEPSSTLSLKRAATTEETRPTKRTRKTVQ
jgi:hypothetical protein